MNTAVDQLSQAQEHRRARVDVSADRHTDEILDHVGLSEDDVVRLSESGVVLGTANVGPEARKKLKGIINRLRTKPHKFTTCMNDLRKNHPEWSDDRRKKTCNVLKQLAGGGKGGGGKATAMSLATNIITCVVDNDVAALLEHVDEQALAELVAEASPPDTGSGGANAPDDQLAELSPKKRKSLPVTAFVFPKERRYPIHDLAHARNALARASGKPEEAAVKAAVYKKFPQLRPSKQKSAA